MPMPNHFRPCQFAFAFAAMAFAPLSSFGQALPPDTGFSPPTGTAVPPDASAPSNNSSSPGGGVLSPGDLVPAGPSTGGNISFEAPAALDNSRPKSQTLGAIRGDQPIMASALLGNVKGQPVFVKDILAPIDQPLRRLGQSARTLTEFRTGARRLIEDQRDSYIREIFIVAAAERALSERERTVVDMYVNKKAMDLRSAHGGSIPAADRYLRAQGSSYDKELANIKRKITVDLYQSKYIAPRIVVTYDMVRAAYDRDPKAWRQEATVELYSLRLPVRRWLPRAQTTDGTVGRVLPNPSAADVTKAENEALATARKLTAELATFPPEKRGAEFARLVEDYGAGDKSDDTLSRGGRTADLKRDSFQNVALADYVFSQPGNTIAQPFLARESDPAQSIVYVLMIGDKRDARVVPFEEAERDIYKQLREAQGNELLREMTQKLINPSEIEAVLRSTDVAVDAAVARYATR
jgi:hypothetical protein